MSGSAMSGSLASASPARAVPRPGHAAVVELVGPAGAGKTSLLQALAASGAELDAGFRLRKHWHVVPALTLVPTYLALYRPRRGAGWKEMKRITYLCTLHRRLQARRGARAQPVILDEGPVYMLARLRVLGGERLRGPGFDRWWRQAVQQWARCLDLIVWLDAPDPLLRERIRTRAQPHTTKHQGDEGMDAFTATYRTAYGEVIRALAAAEGPGVLNVQTADEPMSRVAQRIVTELHGTGGIL